MATQADLTLTMTRAHRRDVLQCDPQALAPTFTLREAADLLERIDGGAAGGATLPELVKALAAARSDRHAGEDDDVRDPIGQPLEVHDEVGTAIVDTLLPVLRRIAGLRPCDLRDPRVPRETPHRRSRRVAWILTLRERL